MKTTFVERITDVSGTTGSTQTLSFTRSDALITYLQFEEKKDKPFCMQVRGYGYDSKAPIWSIR